MASHAYLRVMLETKEGYLTYSGTTKDLNNPDIIVLNSYGIGSFMTPEKEIIKKFLSITSSPNSFNPDECKLVFYHCKIDFYYYCSFCPHKGTCDFINKKSACRLHYIDGKIANPGIITES